MRVRTAILVAMLLGLSAPVDGAEGPGEAAARARAAHAAGKADDLTAIVNARAPEPWIVIEALLTNGDVEVAKALAAKREDFERAALIAYVAWRAASPANPAVTAALRDGKTTNEPAAFLERIEPLLAKGRGVSHVLLAEMHTGAVHALGGGPAAIGESMLVAAAAAEDLGWHKRAFHAYRSAFDRFYHVNDAERLALIPKALLRLAAKSGDKAEASDGHHVAAFALHRQERTEEALEPARKSLALAQAKLQVRNALRLVIMLNIKLGNEHVALRKLEKLNELDRELGDARGAAISDTQLARFEAQLGRSARAMARIERVLAYMNKHGAPADMRGTHLQAAIISRALRDPERSIEHIRRARAAEALALEGPVPVQIDPFQLDKHEALSLALMGRYEEAAALNRKVVAGRTRTTTAIRIYDLMSLAINLAYLGEHAEAAGLFDQAEAMLDPALEPQIRARLHAIRASALVLAAKFDDAFLAAEKAERISRDGLLYDFRALSFGIMGRVWYERGEMKRAVEVFDRMLQQLLARSAMLPDRAGATFRSNVATRQKHASVHYAIEAAAQAGDAGALFQFAERINSVALRNRLGTTEAAESLAPALRERELALQEAETGAVRRFRRAKDRDARSAALHALGSVREELNRHRERMRAEQAAAAQIIDPEIDDLAGTQKRLAPDESLVLYAEGIKHLWALVADRKHARIVKVGAWPAVVQVLDAVVLEDPQVPWQGEVQKLRATLVQPLKLAKGTKRLSIVPTSTLAFMPYAVLFDGPEVTLLPSVTTGRLLAAQPCCGEGTLAVGDPESADGRRLPGSAAEAKAIGDEVLVGKAATEAGIEAALKKRERWRAIHLACHGLIDPFHPLRSALSLTPADDDDGLWTVSELLRTRIAADLAVLGACSTGRGKSFDQEGVLGFVHAFFVAGARQVIVSLWDVDDAATSALLQRFHQEWKAGVAPTTALGRAQRWLRTETRWTHPAYWAAWQLWGPR